MYSLLMYYLLIVLIFYLPSVPSYNNIHKPCIVNDTSTCNYRGQCYNITLDTYNYNISVNVCICDYKYAGPYCEDIRKYQSIAFGLIYTFFIGIFGIHQFYLGNIAYGVMELFLTIIFYIVLVSIYLAIRYEDRQRFTRNAVGSLILIALSAIAITGNLCLLFYDLITIGMNTQLDSHNNKLISW